MHRFNKHFNTHSPTKANMASKKKNNKTEKFGTNAVEIFHHSADFGTCHLWFFSLYKLMLLLQRTQHTGGIFTEHVLPGPSSAHRDQMLPRCVYNSIFFSTAATTRAAGTAQDLGVSSEFPLYELQLIPRLVEKTRAGQAFYRPPGENMKKEKNKSKCFEEFV